VTLGKFQGLSQDGQQADFVKTLCASVSNDFTFSQIHLDGQYLKKKYAKYWITGVPYGLMCNYANVLNPQFITNINLKTIFIIRCNYLQGTGTGLQPLSHSSMVALAMVNS
jgi:hypothetical protein